LELGAGTSLPGLYSFLKGHDVILTDIKKFVPFIDDIIELNKKQETNLISVHQLHWEDNRDIQALKELYNTFNLIIGSELIYLEEYFDDLINVLDQFSDNNTKIYFSFKIRLPEMTEIFLTKLTGKQFKYAYIDQEFIHTIYPGTKLQIITIFK
jgi:hypothetical protein